MALKWMSKSRGEERKRKLLKDGVQRAVKKHMRKNGWNEIK
jgi:hypothetical protein